MKSDALFQLGIVSVCLHTTQTENSTRGISAVPGTPWFRLSAGSAGVLRPSQHTSLKPY